MAAGLAKDVTTGRLKGKLAKPMSLPPSRRRSVGTTKPLLVFSALKVKALEAGNPAPGSTP
jgi:hypothetical protein